MSMTIVQVQYIEACINSYQHSSHSSHSSLALYYNLPTAEHRRLTNELAYSPIGTILEACTPVGDAISGVNRRYFWKKTPHGIFQVITNHEVNAMHSVVFDP